MRILYLNPDRGIPVLGDKGASVHVREFVSAAAALGHEVTLSCTTLGDGNPPPPVRIVHFPDEADEEALTAECRATGLGPEALADQVTRREIARLAHDRGLADRVIGALSASGFRPDLVYERHALFHRAGAMVAGRLGVPRILEVNAPLIDEQRRFRGLSLELQARAAERASYEAADAIVAVSDAVADHVAKVLGRRCRIHVVPNGVDTGRFAAADEAGREIRERLGLGDAPVAGFVGSFKAWHGVPFLLEAFAAIAARFPAARLLAVGDGPEREAVANRAAALGLAERVILPGRVPHGEIPAWLGAMDFTVAPYLPQPDFYFSPLKIFESLAAGRPVVAPDTGGIADVVADGETGLLYAPGDGAALEAALGTMFADRSLRAAMAVLARSGPGQRDWRDVVRYCLSLADAELPCSSAA